MLTRRLFLQTSGALATCVAAGPLTGAATPQTARRTKSLVLVFLRGGCDGLNLIIPHGDARYGELRGGGVAIPRPGRDNGALDLDGFFSLHPRAAALHPLFQEGTAVAAHAVGNARNTRSHFEEQDVWETGVLENTARSDGWLNRHLQTTEAHGPIRAISVGDSLPRILRGDAEAIALRSLSDLSLGDPARLPDLAAALERAHAGDGLVERSARTTLEAIQELQAVAAQPYESDVAYPETDLARRMREVARMVKAGIGVEVCGIDYGGWDTHQYQGGVGGPFGNLVEGLAGALAAFGRDLGGALDDVLVLVVSEFGRTARQNGTGGTDHGWGNCVLALGGPVHARSGGSARGVVGTWPGLDRDALVQERDLAHTTDFRDVFAEAVSGHLGNKNLEAVLPGHEASPVGLIGIT